MKITLVVVLTVLLSFDAFAGYKPVTEEYSSIGIVDCPNYLNIRQSASLKSPVIGIIRNRGGCEILAVGETWYKLKSGDIVGYALKEYVLSGDEAREEAIAVAVKKARFMSAGTVFAERSEDSRAWVVTTPGSVYEVLEDDGEWLRVDMYGADGYIPISDSVELFYGLDVATKTYNLTSVSKDREAIVKYAMRFLGNRYVWGGTDPYTGVDCSGFVRYVYNKKRPDIYLPRVSYEQCNYGNSVSSLDMRPGDLLFYANSVGTVHHVAMYIGNGMIVHAASRTQGIIISPWNYQIPKYIKNVLND